MDLPTISVIVLNYNGKHHLGDCFASLLAMDYPADRRELVLVDNASQDDSVDFIREHFPTVRIVQNETNLGFAAGNNRGAEMVQSEYIAFLNPDTRVDVRWLREMVQACLREPEMVCVGSRILSWDASAIDFADAGMNFMGWGLQLGIGTRQPKKTPQAIAQHPGGIAQHPWKELLFACGGGMLIKRQVFLAAGGFDPDFFAFFEDVDLGWRLWLMGYKIALAPQAVIYHRHHGSWGAVNDAQKWVLYERNTLASVIKNYDDVHLARVLPAVLLLMMQRAYLDVRPDPRIFGSVPAASSNPFLRLRYYLGRIRELLAERALGELLRGAISKIGESVVRQSESLSQSTLGPDGNTESARGIAVPVMAISRLVAARDVLHSFPTLMRKRQFVQAARRRTDQQIFPLFRQALVSNFNDREFIRAMQVAIARFGLVKMFDGKTGSSDLEPRLIDLSREACLAMLRVMDRTLTLTGVPEANFRLGGPKPATMTPVPTASVAALVEMYTLLWLLPDAPLQEGLTWLAARCEQILNSADLTHPSP